jgi:hypothetical protein
MEAGSDIFSSEGHLTGLSIVLVYSGLWISQLLSSRGPTAVFSNQSGPVRVETVGNRGYSSDGGRPFWCLLFLYLR